MKKLYFVSAIVQYKGCKQPWLLADCSGNLSLEEAMEEVIDMKSKFEVLSAWIDVFDENNVKQTVFHECYIDYFGTIRY